MRLTQSEFDALELKLDEGSQKCIDASLRTMFEVDPLHEVYLIYHLHDDNKVFCCEVFLKHETLELQIVNYSGKYRIWCRSFENLKNVKKYDIPDLIKNVKEPNQIGKLSASKIKQWINYYEQVFPIVQKHNDKNKKLIDLFMNKLEGFEVRWSHDKKSGTIEKNNIEFSFTVSADYVNQSIHLPHKVSHSIEDFAKLSDNGYGKKENTKKLIKF